MFLVRLIKRLVKAVVWIVVLVLLVPVLGLAYGFLTTNSLPARPAPDPAVAPPAALGTEIRAAIPGYQRPEESTYLTYPEWAIVYAAREYAAFLGEQRESAFPYWAYIGRYWQDYATMIRASADYPFNFANHQMLVVIGTSHTIEQLIQWAYENTVGRITEATSARLVAADGYIMQVAADYAAFLDQVPWYEFPYSEKRAGLMALQRKPGDDEVRTEERRYAFGTAWAVKQAYADLIRSGLSATAEPAALDIHVWAKGPVGEATRSEADTALERDMGAEGAVFVTRRYQVFTDMIPRLIGHGVSFVEIGGNDEIMLTVLSTNPVAAVPGASEIFSYALPADPATRRTGLVVAVPRLHEVVPALTRTGVRLEHVYDY